MNKAISLRYKCNKCKDEFELNKQDEWSAYCFHCGEGLLQLIKIHKINSPITKRSDERIISNEKVKKIIRKFVKLRFETRFFRWLNSGKAATSFRPIVRL